MARFPSMPFGVMHLVGDTPSIDIVVTPAARFHALAEARRVRVSASRVASPLTVVTPSALPPTPSPSADSERDAMTTIAFIGLGVMGRPMAVNLTRADIDLTATSRSEKSRARAADAGVPVVGSISELPSAPDIVVTMLPDSPDVERVLFGPGGVVARLTSPTLIVDMSTIAPGASRSLAERLAAEGHRMLDAPVSGGEAAAIEGTLSIMVGGDVADLARARPMLDVVGATIVHVGPAGSGQVVKAANQLIVAGNLQMLAEALVFIEAHGVDAAEALDVIGGGLAGSAALTRKRAALLSRDFTPGFRLALHNKDLGIVAASARERGLALPVASLVSQLVASLVARGDGALDHSALYKLATELSPLASGPNETREK